jgi:E3 ubiquitin-protein ligase RGLG
MGNAKSKNGGGGDREKAADGSSGGTASGGGGGGGPKAAAKKGTEKAKGTFQRIEDKYETLDEVSEALRTAGLESSNLIIALDFTKSTQWTGRKVRKTALYPPPPPSPSPPLSSPLFPPL